MRPTNQIQAELSTEGRLLTLRYEGNITEAMIKAEFDRLAHLTEETAPGFTLLVDFSLLEEMEFACSTLIGKMMDRFNARGVARIVRVIPNPDKDIGLNILSIFHYESSLPIIVFETRAEADAFLSRRE